MLPVPSELAVTGSNGTGTSGSGLEWKNNFRFVTTVINNNIVRISGGALGFPVL